MDQSFKNSMTGQGTYLMVSFEMTGRIQVITIYVFSGDYEVSKGQHNRPVGGDGGWVGGCRVNVVVTGQIRLRRNQTLSGKKLWLFRSLLIYCIYLISVKK